MFLTGCCFNQVTVQHKVINLHLAQFPDESFPSMESSTNSFLILPCNRYYAENSIQYLQVSEGIYDYIK